ncbi:hypothetical protein NMG60_11035596 [Bertholletia excelsa]
MARLMSRRRTWVGSFIVVYTILLVISWNILKSIIHWHEISPSTSTLASLKPSSPSTLSSGCRALCASAAVGAVAWLLSTAAALAVAVPAAVLTWITVVVLLALSGKSRRALVAEGQKLTVELTLLVAKRLVKEGNFVAAVCAVFGYFAIFRRSSEG